MMRKILLAAGTTAAIGLGVLAGAGGPAIVPHARFPDPDGEQAIRREEAIVDQDCSVGTEPVARATSTCPQQYAALVDLQQNGRCLQPDIAPGQPGRWARCDDDRSRKGAVSSPENAL
jgi:hypothetical protein